MMANSLKDFLTKLKTQLAAEKKKAAILGVLLIVFLLVIGHTLMSGSTPEEAQAVSPPVATAGTTTQRRLPKPNKSAPRVAASSDPKVSPTHENPLSSKKAVPVKDMPRVLARDIFSTPSWDKFKFDMPEPPAGSAEDESQQGPSWFTQFGWKIAEYQRTHSQTVEQIEAELEGLELQSTMTGSSRSAYISGRLIRVGDTIRGFSVVEIEDRRVTLRKSGVEKALTMR